MVALVYFTHDWDSRFGLRLLASRVYQDRGYVCQSLGLLWACLALVGCASIAGPDYQRPDVTMKSGWSLTTETPAKGSESIKLDWWTEFGDPYLNTLVERAISNNLSIQIAAARVAEAGTLIGAAEAQRLPTVTGSAATQGTFQGTFRGRSSLSRTVTNVGASLGWELDIWGKLKKGVEAQEANYQASEADWRAIWLIIVSDVATTYFFIRQLDEQTAAQERSLKAAEHIVSVYTIQAQIGLKTRSDVMTQHAELNFIKTGLLELQRQRTLAENALATLLGTPAGDFHVPIAALEDTVRLPEVPTGLPSDILKRRPDVLAAEYRVLAVHDLVGQARLAQLPSIRFSVDGGANNLLSSAIAAWTFGLGPSIDIPIFDPGLQAAIKTNEAVAKTTEQEYRLTVISAFQEVEDALVSLNNHKVQRVQILDRLKQLEGVAGRVRKELDMGLVTQLQVLEIERTLRDASLDRLSNHQQLLADTITLYKALGGGWPTTMVRTQ